MSLKYLKAMAVASSKNVGFRGSKKVRLCATKSMTYSSLMSSPLILMRSRKSTRWGEVYSPTL